MTKRLLGLAVILLFAGYLRLHQHVDNPMWYTDEATHINIAHYLAQGQIRYLAVDDSVLLFARVPLFHALLAGVSAIFGEGMATLRGLTGMLGVINVLLVYGMAYHLSKRDSFALLAAGCLAIYPDAVLYNRFGFSYNLLAPLVLLMVWGLVVYWRTYSRKWLFMAGFALGLGLITDIMAGSFILPLMLIVCIRRWRDALWILLVILFPFGLYAALMLLAAPDAFWFDLQYTLSRLNTMTLPEQIDNVIQNYTVLFNKNFWFPLGFLGIIWIVERDFRWIAALFLFFPLFSLARTVALFNLSFYYMIPLLPLIALGVAAALDGLWRSTANIPLKIGVLLLVVGIPLADSVNQTLHDVNNGYITEIDGFLINPDHARVVADFINANTIETDVVIASAGMGWLFHANTADFQMVVAYDGVEVVHLPGDMPQSRFAFDPRYESARFVVIDDLWRMWGAVHIPGVAAMMQDVEANWSLVLQQGTIWVYKQTGG